MYARIENNQIVGVFRALPASFANISGFNLLSPEQLATHGILPLEEVKPALAVVVVSQSDEGETTVPVQRYGASTDAVSADKATRTYSVEAIPADELNVALAGIYIKAMETYYDSKAKEKRYDNHLTCALRAGYPGPFQSEGIAFAVWMDTCNAHGYLVLAEVMAGERAMPTTDNLIAELPAMVWP